MRSRVLAATVGVAAVLVAVPSTPATSVAPRRAAQSRVRATPAASAPARRTTAHTGKAGAITLAVDTAKRRHAISPLVYGVNFASQTSGLRKAFRVPVDRWGGNSTSRYNYLNHTYNTGSDWYFENIVSGSGDTLDDFVAGDQSRGSASVVTVPMTGWVSKGSPSSHPFTCSFPRSTWANQDSFDPWDSECGNGTRNGYTVELDADPTTTSTAVGAPFVQAMVQSLVSTYGTAAEGGVGFFELDNEPTLWNSTHRDVHPDPLTYDELWTRSHATAAAVKAADPSTAVLGPSDWGWCAYFYSAADSCGGSPSDHNAHGGTPLGAWYLQQFAAADAGGDGRLLDYFDEHYYPQAEGVSLSGAGGAATQRLRLRSTRSLWDPHYADESWISDANGGEPLQWLRTMNAWVDAYYPGTKTAITEYNWGGLESMNGALAQADVLGIFGREGLDLATLWGPTKASDPWAFAFRIYRNYDGASAKFGDTSVKATSSAQGRLAAYAATRSSDGALTVVVINKTGSAIPAKLALSSFAGGAKAKVWRYSAAHPRDIVRAGSVALSGGRLATTYPKSSITLLVLPAR
ncbi:MAG: glycoside hydrolase family 44 protein [Nocardioidaceae bacterium]